jgi:hypothetical protein
LIVRSVAKILQRRLQVLYGLEDAPCVSDYVTLAAPGEREQLLLRQCDPDHVELRLVVPDCPLREALVPSLLSDSYLQVVEGVSHFVLVAERIRAGRPTSQLELELQAEVDKLVLVQHCLQALPQNQSQPHHRSQNLHHKLYGQVRFLHPPGSEQGDRYRLANRLAARFTRQLGGLDMAQRRALLRRFYRMNLSEKIRVAEAA